jgi:RNA polymerase sigma factor (sigma-70 family)
VLSQAHKYFKESMSLSVVDLCQEGILGLIHGVDKFDPRKGYRLSTYAIYWIRNSILRAQTRSGHLLRTPFNIAAVSKLSLIFCLAFFPLLAYDHPTIHPSYPTVILQYDMSEIIGFSFDTHSIVLQHKQSIKRTSMDLLMEKERAPTHKEVMERLGLGQARYRNILQTGIRPGSMHARCRITGKELVENLVDKEDQGSRTWKFSGDVVLRCGMDDVVML